MVTSAEGAVRITVRWRVVKSQILCLPHARRCMPPITSVHVNVHLRPTSNTRPKSTAAAHSLRNVGNCDGVAFVTTAAECTVAAQSLDLLAAGAGPRLAQLTSNPFGCYLKVTTGAVFFNPNGNVSSTSLARVSICRTATECRAGQRIDESTGRCADCGPVTVPAGSFSTSTNATECNVCAHCRSDPAAGGLGPGFDAGFGSQLQYEVVPCTLTSDTVCADYQRQCTPDEFIAAAATPTSDTACETCRVRNLSTLPLQPGLGEVGWSPPPPTVVPPSRW